MTSQPCSLPLSPVRPPGYLLTSDLLAWLCPAADVTLAACRLTPTLSSSSSSLSSTRPQSYLSGKKKELHHLLLLPLAAPATDRLGAAAEDGMIDLNDAAKCSRPISQLLSSAVSGAVKDWTRSLCRQAELRLRSNSHAWPPSDGRAAAAAAVVA